MGTLWRIRDRSTFAQLRRQGRRVRRGPITITWLPEPGGHPPRVAFAVGRGVGPAVVRNRVRRRLREIMRERAEGVAPGAYLVGAAPAVVALSFEELATAVSDGLAALPPSSERAGR